MVAAILSELSGRPVRGDVAMTGEITLSGLVLPVGGIKEKVLAARRLGIFDVVLPRRNEKHVKEDLTDELRREINVHYVSTIDEVLELALTPAAPAPPRPEDSLPPDPCTRRSSSSTFPACGDRLTTRMRR